MDLLPGTDAGTMLVHWKNKHPRSLLRTHLSHHLPHKLVLELQDLIWQEFAERPLADWPDKDLQSVGSALNRWRLHPAGTEGYRTAEVTLGGVDTQALSSKTMESTTPGLFFIGEVVDVTGHLGGFNFQWAWSSGYAAGVAL
jgi:predicted flavoprotein YhiN